jgi:hypothetical protein
MATRNLIIFDFDCTLSSRHFWGLMMSDDKVKADDLSLAHALRGGVVNGFGTPNATILKSIDNERKELLISYVFGSTERLEWLKSFVTDLAQIPNVSIEIWTRSHGTAIHDILSQSWINFRANFNEIIDRTTFKSNDKSRLCESRRSQYKNIFIFDDSAEEFTYPYTNNGGIFSTFENIHFYNQLTKEGTGIPIDYNILQSIKLIIRP